MFSRNRLCKARDHFLLPSLFELHRQLIPLDLADGAIAELLVEHALADRKRRAWHDCARGHKLALDLGRRAPRAVPRRAFAPPIGLCAPRGR